MRSRARVVVVGGGCVGAGVLHALAHRGWRDVVLVERTRLTAGSTWHAAGLIPTYARNHAIARLINRSISIYAGLEAETGLSIGWHPCGQLRTANSPERLDEFRSYMDVAAAQGADAHLLGPSEIRALWPELENPRILAGLYHPGDGHLAPSDVTMALVAGARALGATVEQNCEVTGFRRTPSGEWVVVTSRGEIVAEHVVLATGNYARQTGAMLGLDIPAIPIVHQYWVTTPVPEIVARKKAGEPERPILRDEDFCGYIREEGDGLMFGPYETIDRLQLFAEDGVPEWFGADLLEEDFDAVAPQWEAAARSVPMLGRAGIKANVRGPFQMTADELPLAGPAWGLPNVWLAEGVPGGILWGAALGDQLADWITTGDTEFDMSALDPRRFGGHANKEWTRQSVRETWGSHADLHFPGSQPIAGRPQRTVPVHDTLARRGAVFALENGWEVPSWFAPVGVEATETGSFRHRPEDRHVGAEAMAVRTAAGLIEATSTAKFEVVGPDAAERLDRVLANRLPSPGRQVLAHLLTPHGGVAAEFRVARLAPDHFLLTTSAPEERRAGDLLARALSPDGRVALRETTEGWGLFMLAGPRARGILAAITEDPVDGAALPSGGVRVASCGLVPDVRILRTVELGELCFELHHPISHQRTLFAALLAAGEPQGLRLVGRRALHSLHREKSRRCFGPDMNPSLSALASGLAPFLAFEKGPFVGREALLAEAADGRAPRLTALRVATTSASLRGDESVLADGRLVGRVTSGGWSWMLGHDVALALLPPNLATSGAALTVSVLGEPCPALIVPDAPYDPTGTRAEA